MNTPKDSILSVSEINNLVKKIIDGSFEEFMYVEGEISQVQKSQLGHIYITIGQLLLSRTKKMSQTPKYTLSRIFFKKYNIDNLANKILILYVKELL